MADTSRGMCMSSALGADRAQAPRGLGVGVGDGTDGARGGGEGVCVYQRSSRAIGSTGLAPIGIAFPVRSKDRDPKDVP
jgi:hypothetical protein